MAQESETPVIPDSILPLLQLPPLSSELNTIPHSGPVVTGYTGYAVRFRLAGSSSEYDFNMLFDDAVFDEGTRLHLYYSVLLWGRFPFGNGSFAGCGTPRNQSLPFNGRGPLTGQALNDLINHPNIGEGVAINMANYWTFIADGRFPKVSLYIDGLQNPTHPDSGGPLGEATVNAYGANGDLRIRLNQLAVGPNSTWYLAMDRLSWAETLSHEVLHTFGWQHPNLPRSDPEYQRTFMFRWLRNRFGPETYRKEDDDAYRYDQVYDETNRETENALSMTQLQSFLEPQVGAEMNASPSQQDVNPTTPTGLFHLPIADEHLEYRPGPIVGWSFWELTDFKDGRSVEARAYVDDPSPDSGPRKVRCAAHDILYDEAMRQGIPYIQKLGDCNYAISWDDLATYKWSGPSAVREPDFHSTEAPTVAVKVTYGARRVDILQNNVVVEGITYVISRNPNFNPIAAYWFSWTGHGPGTGVRSPSGFFHVDFGGACKDMSLPAGTYYIRANYQFRVGGGGLQFLHGEIETFTV